MASKKKGSKAEETDKAKDEAAPAVTTAAKALAKAEADNAPASDQERAEFQAEKERRERRVIEANEKAMRDGQVAETKDGRTGVTTNKNGDVIIFNTGQFAFVPLKDVPTWALHHLMGDALDHVKWRGLTKEQQAEVSKELAKRSGASAVDQSIFPPGQGAGAVSDLETVQERRAKEASPIPVGSGPQTPTFGEAESQGRGTGTIGGPGGQPEVEGSRKETDAAIDKAAEEGTVGTGKKEDATEGVTGVETGSDGDTAGKGKSTASRVKGAVKKTTATLRKK